ncbi:hypothetical protein C8F01DRAFT_1267368 [Mycena amicta]|nr:hypothetical protein C8F01DRAFT_1267368 [Mycena amicta]
MNFRRSWPDYTGTRGDGSENANGIVPLCTRRNYLNDGQLTLSIATTRNQLSKPPVREEVQIAAQRMGKRLDIRFAIRFSVSSSILRCVFASEVHKHIGKPWGRRFGHVHIRTLTNGNWRAAGNISMGGPRRWEAGEEEEESWAWREENAAADWETTDEYAATNREPPSLSISLPLAVANQSMGLSSGVQPDICAPSASFKPATCIIHPTLDIRRLFLRGTRIHDLCGT